MPNYCKADGCSQRCWGGGYCKRHQYKRGKTEDQQDYDRESKKFREENPVCAIGSPDCKMKTQGVHHKRGRGKYLMDKSTWVPACNPCNMYVEAHHAWAVENGHKESRLTI